MFLKRFFIILFLSQAVVFLSAQENASCDCNQKVNPDSLQTVLQKSTNATERLDLYQALGNYYVEVNRDSALNYIELFLHQARQLNLKLREAQALDKKGYILMKFGHYSESLNCFLAAYKIAGNPANETPVNNPVFSTPRDARLDVLAYIHHDWGHLMRNTDNLEQARFHYFETKKTANEVKDTSLLALANMNLGNVYIKLNALDSALIFEKEAAALTIKSGFLRYLGNTYRLTGDIYMKKGDRPAALKYYHLAFQSAKEQNNRSGLSGICNALTKYYFQQGQKDSSLYYAVLANREISSLGAEVSGEWNQGAAYNNLYLAYDLKGEPDSVLKYLKLALATKDSLYTKRIKSFSAFQNLSFQEQLRLKELEDAQVAVRNKIRIYSLLGFIGIFLLIMFFLYRSNRQERKANILLEQTLVDLRSTQSQLVDQKERAEYSEKAKQRFLANMSHEIRTPMNAVMGMTDLLLSKKPREDQFYYLNGIKKSADTLLHIINDILDLSKIEAGKVELENIDFSLPDLLEQVILTFRHKADGKGLRLMTQIDAAVPAIVIGDPVRLNQVLNNLVGNAIKFTEKGSVLIAISEVPELTGIRFSVIDTGIGIPADKLQKVFESFSQANASDTRQYGGTGLGLTISQELIGLMGSEIAIESREGQGTIFSFVLKLAKGAAERLQRSADAEVHPDGAILNGLSVLIVDDNEFNLMVAKDSIEYASNAEVVAVESAKEAIDLLQKRSFDVILMDVQMPEMNGLDATHYIRSHFDPPVQNIPIIALTASVLAADVEKCKKAGMNAYLAKPFSQEQLIAVIASLLNR